MDSVDKKAAGLKIMSEMFGPNVSDEYTKRSTGFAPEFMTISVDNVYGGLWARPGLSRRDRSLLTVAILIQARAIDALRVHLQLAVNNGVTKAEIAEIIYHATAYCGFPSANSARDLAMELFDEE